MTSLEKLGALLLSAGLTLAIGLSLTGLTHKAAPTPAAPEGKAAPTPAPGPPAKWRADSYEEALQLGAALKRPVLVDVGVRGCLPCRRLEASLADPKVVSVLAARYVMVSVDGDKRRDLVKAFGVTSYPTLLVVDPSAPPAVQRMAVGSKSPDELVGWLQ